MCLAGAVVAFWSLTQVVAGSSPFTVMITIFVTEFAEFTKFSETIRKNCFVDVELITSGNICVVILFQVSTNTTFDT